MTGGPTDAPMLVLSLQPAGRGERRLAVAAIFASIAVFIIAAPLARIPLPESPVFIPGYESSLVTIDLITAVLLFGQFTINRARALLVLASGYLFAAFLTVPHVLTFPGLFSKTGLLGAGPQTTAWLYMFWHGGFPVFVAAYAVLKTRNSMSRRPAACGIARSIVAVACVAGLLTLLATAGEAALPPIMQGDHYAVTMIVAVAVIWGLSFLALVMVFVRGQPAVLDLWLMAVLSAWLCEFALSAVFNGQRFDLGYYAGRIHGLAAASFVLMVLLLETVALYARFARSVDVERQERERRYSELRLELIHLSRVSELGQMVSTLAHEVNQPLTAIGNYLRAGQRLAAGGGDPATLQSALGKAVDEATRASAIIRRLRDFIRKNDGARRAEEMRLLLEETVALALPGPDRQQAQVDVRVDPEARLALVDRIQVQQVLLNLVRNAAEASSGIGPLSLVIATAPAADGMVEVSVADRGPGLSDAVREKLFQPFVTTKRSGMGVGLSICQSIVEAHGGRIWAEDNPGGGTVFRFTVPDARAAAEVVA